VSAPHLLNPKTMCAMSCAPSFLYFRTNHTRDIRASSASKISWLARYICLRLSAQCITIESLHLSQITPRDYDALLPKQTTSQLMTFACINFVQRGRHDFLLLLLSIAAQI
jgi:hypothetical protein